MALRKALWASAALFLLAQHAIFAAASIPLDLTSVANIKSVSRQLADSTMKYYIGNQTGQTPGLLPTAGAYQWWIAGGLFGQMIEYWSYTGDATYNDVITEGMLFQTGPDNDFEPTNQTRTEGNDDQAFWAFAAMTAAELKFPNPPESSPQWLALAQAVFNRQAGRWDTGSCGGGLRWQFNSFNSGYGLKNSISNGCFFLLSSRLARYTKNTTYAEWADKTYDWMDNITLIDNSTWAVYDSISYDVITEACNNKPRGDIQWTYNIGTVLAGCAYMWNFTQEPIWETRLNKFLDHTQTIFFSQQYGGGKVLAEYACEINNNCNSDQQTFKAWLSRWLAVTVQLAPFTEAQIMPWLQGSATAISNICNGAGEGTTCGRKWWVSTNDGSVAVGNQMTAMAMVQANLILNTGAPVDNGEGTSKGNPAAGSNVAPINPADFLPKITVGDKVGAWIITVVLLLALISGAFFMIVDEDVSDLTSRVRRMKV